MSESRSRPRPAGSRVGDGEIETSGTEKVLAVVLAVFIAIGAIWGYVKLDEVAEKDSTYSYLPDQKLLGPEEFSVVESHRQAVSSVQTARRDRRAVIRRLELRREAYRTALDAGEPSAELRTEYESAQARLALASRELAAAVKVEAQTRPGALLAKERLTELRQDAAERADEDRARHDRIVFLLRLGLLVLMLAGAYRLLSRLRSRNSRYLPAALAWIGATAALAAVMATDYTDSYLEFDEVGPLAISIVGIALTLVAFVALQRFLAKRVPVRRVRRGECPFCGFPIRDKPHCEGCGRAVIASCSSCQKDRRVGTPRCGYCGNS
ncbi:MAG TPA: zinc ribbon domain-containing protein [Solirubrobacterales bacterium]|nr:zinc ribbon domain-containing protein [Solirubrobacterales bacterium]